MREKPRANHHAIIGANRVNARVNVRLEFALLVTAPPYIDDTGTWGVSDPAGLPRGDVCDAEVGSLTPHHCADVCAGAHDGRHMAPPDPVDGDLAKNTLSNDLQRTAVAGWIITMARLDG